MFYKGKIFNITNKKWIKDEVNGEVTYTTNEGEALLFNDLTDGLNTVEMLNDMLSDSFTLVDDETNKNYIQSELLGKFNINQKTIDNIVNFLNDECLYDDILAETEFDKDEGEHIIQIRCFQEEEEKHKYLFKTDGVYLTDFVVM